MPLLSKGRSSWLLLLSAPLHSGRTCRFPFFDSILTIFNRLIIPFSFSVKSPFLYPFLFFYITPLSTSLLFPMACLLMSPHYPPFLLPACFATFTMFCSLSLFFSSLLSYFSSSFLHFNYILPLFSQISLLFLHYLPFPYSLITLYPVQSSHPLIFISFLSYLPSILAVLKQTVHPSIPHSLPRRYQLIMVSGTAQKGQSQFPRG